MLESTYLQPASLIRLAYIFPMSPMPMMPTTAFCIFSILAALAHESHAEAKEAQSRDRAPKTRIRRCRVLYWKETLTCSGGKVFVWCTGGPSVKSSALANTFRRQFSAHKAEFLHDFTFNLYPTTTSPLHNHNHGTQEEGRARCAREHLSRSPSQRRSVHPRTPPHLSTAGHTS